MLWLEEKVFMNVLNISSEVYFVIISACTNPSMTLGFKFQLLPTKEDFLNL
jgi:hypothetical protein